MFTLNVFVMVLYHFEINIQFPHQMYCIVRSILEALSMKVFIGVLERYENLLQDFIGDDATPREGKERMTVPQSCALQLLFNFKFFSSVLVHPSIEEVLLDY